MLPISLLRGWGSSNKTKGFHQVSFAAEYAMLAVWRHRQQTEAVIHIKHDLPLPSRYYNLQGQLTQGSLDSLPRGLYVTLGQKFFVK
jgi:hypothetical protein